MFSLGEMSSSLMLNQVAYMITTTW